MKTQIDFIRYSRTSVIKLLDEMSLQQINTIPQGFKNNPAWQLGHLVLTLQSYCYGGAGLEVTLDQELVDMYKNGTVPERDITKEELVTLKELALTNLDQFEKDLAANVFAGFEPKVLGNGIALGGIQDAVEMMVFHEAMHLGETKMLKNAIAA